MGQKLEKQLNRLTHKPEAQRFASLVHTDTDDVDAIDEYEEEDAA